MKKILSIAALLISLSVSAQGNLQFNQVITINQGISLNATCSYSNAVYTVPANKVLKIENMQIFTGGACQGANFSINNTGINAAAPIWLKAGDVISVNYSAFGCTGCATTAVTLSGRHFISAIEFNVVP